MSAGGRDFIPAGMTDDLPAFDPCADLVAETNADARRSMLVGLRALLPALGGILFIAGLSGYHAAGVRGSVPMVGHHLPVGAIFYTLIVTIAWNLSIRRSAFPRQALSNAEMGFILAVTLASCYAPTSGLFRYLQRQAIMPWYLLSQGGRTEWFIHRVLERLDPSLFPSPTPVIEGGVVHLDASVYHEFAIGKMRAHPIGLSEVPWRAWVTPMLRWTPVILLMNACALYIGLTVHRQWVRHEQLSYPIAQVLQTLVMRSSRRRLPQVFRTRLFWWGFVPLFLLYALEYAHRWYPENIPGMRTLFPDLKHWYLPLRQYWPVLRQTPHSWELSGQNIFFAVVGLAYFVPIEISLTMGLSNILINLVGLIFFMSSGVPLRGGDIAQSRAGAFMAYAIMLLYAGRAYYLPVLRQAIGIRGRSKADPLGVFAARWAIVLFVGFVAALIYIGFDPLPALCYALLLQLMFLVLSRILCETGLPFLHSGWMPTDVMLTLFGPAAIGARALVYALYLNTVLCQDPRECFLPYASTGLRLAEQTPRALKRMALAIAVTIVLAFAVGFISTTWTQYNYGALSTDSWAGRNVPQIPFDNAARLLSQVENMGQLEIAETGTRLQRLLAISPEPGRWPYLLVGFVGVIVLFSLRYRFTRFPIHPVLLLMWGTWPANRTWASLLLGCAAKALVVRFGGGRVYQRLKPFFIGIIVAEVLAAGTIACIELVWHLSSGQTPRVGFWNLAS